MSQQPIDPYGTRLPIKLDTTSNGEFVPVPLSAANRAANRLAHEAATRNAKRLALSRRSFLVSACGAASTLLAFNAANAAAGRRGGFFELEPEAALEPQLAAAKLGDGEFIFDVQGHFVDPNGTWVKNAPPDAFRWSPKAACAYAQEPGPRSHLRCLGPEEFVKDIFLDSDTDLMVLSFVPSRRDAEPVTIEAADAVRRIVDRLQGTHRLLIHGRVNPNQPGDVEAMDELAERWKVSAWKTYTQFGPGGKGFFLSDDVGIRFIEKARALGIKVICVHKGLPFGKQSYEHSQCSDIGVVAKRFPDVSFLVYHSGFVSGVPEQAYAGGANRDGIDTLIKSLVENGVAAQLERLRRARQHVAVPHARPGAGGARTRQALPLLRREQRALGHRLDLVRLAAGPDPGVPHLPDRARAAGEARLPGDHAGAARQGVRAERDEAVPDERGGGPQVHGGDGGRDEIARERLAYRERPDPHFRTYGPKTRREFMNLLGWNGGAHA